MPAQHPPRGGRAHPFSRPTHLTGATPPPLPTLTTSHRAPGTAPNPAPYLGELSATRWHRHAYPAGNPRPPPAADHRLRANPQPAPSGALAVAMRGRAAVFQSPPLLRASSTPPHNHGLLDNPSSVSLHVIARIKEFIPVGLNASMCRPLLHEFMHRLVSVLAVFRVFRDRT
jgi:hypothetical protein